MSIDDTYTHIYTQMAVESAAGILHLHSEGVVHRDIATRNLLLTEDWRVCVCDFGMSRFTQNKSYGKTQSFVGPIKVSVCVCVCVCGCCFSV